MRILICEHCLTKVAVNDDSICPACREPTTDVGFTPAEDSEVHKPRNLMVVEPPQTMENSAFFILSLFFAACQFASLIFASGTRHAAAYADLGGPPLPSIVFEVMLTQAIAIAILFFGVANSVKAGRRSTFCIIVNLISCGVCLVLALEV